MSRVETTRLGMNIPTELLVKLDEYAERMNISRTSAVCVLLSQALDSQKAITDMGELLRVIQEVQKKQTIAD